MHVKQVLAAAIVQDILFRSLQYRDLFLEQLRSKHIVYIVMDEFIRQDGSVIIRIAKQYNHSEFIEL